MFMYVYVYKHIFFGTNVSVVFRNLLQCIWKKHFTKSFTNTAGIKNESNKLAKMKENVKITPSKSHECNERNICVITKIM